MSGSKLPLWLFIVGCLIEAVGIGVFAFRALPAVFGILIIVAGLAVQGGAFLVARRIARASQENSAALSD